MRTNRIRIPALGMAIAICSMTFGQEALLRKADRLYEQYSFAQAINCYERAFGAGAQNVEAARRLADSYRRVREVGKSEQWYALVTSTEGATAQDLYNYADALRANGRYAKADSVMGVYARMGSVDTRIERQARTAELYGLFLIDPVFEGEMKPVSMNTDEMELSPVMWNDRLVFASSIGPDVGVERKHAWNDKPFLNLYIMEEGAPRLLKGTVNTRYHESDPAFSADGSEMYFTRNGYLDGRTEVGSDGFNNLHIYSCRFENGKWGTETAFAWNDASWSTGHPALSADGGTLYFASDRPGGMGGTDIWMCRKDSAGGWSTPEVLGPGVNTEGNELFPSISGDHALFFASDGHAGLGGMDLFLSWIFDGDAQPAVNLGDPVNSRGDDISLILDRTKTNVWFSSDRPGGKGAEDLYHMELDEPFKEKVRIRGRLISAETGEGLARMPVRLRTPDRKAFAQRITDSEGRYEFIVQPKAMTVWGGIPGASEEELPMDEHLLVTSDGDIEMEDVRLSTIFRLPLSIRILDAVTGLPAHGVTVELHDSAHTRWSVIGTTDEQGVFTCDLPNAQLGETQLLEVRCTYQDLPVSQELVSIHVRDGTMQHMVHRMDMGRYTSAAVIENLRDHLPLIDPEPAEDGSVWSGLILDGMDGHPLSNVPVTLLDIRGGEITRTVTDANGRYLLRSSSIPFALRAAIPGGEAVVYDNISPFGDDHLPDMRMDGVMDLPVNAVLTDAITAEPLEDVLVTIIDQRNGSVLFTASTDARGIVQGTIPDRRFGTEQNIEVRFSKEGYLSASKLVDFSVLAFMDQSLGGPEGFRLIPDLGGVDLGDALRIQPIKFDYNRAEIRPDAAEQLDVVAHVMSMDPGVIIELRSHTDSRGGNAFNQFLSVQRAQNSKAYLVSKGIDPARLKATGLGEREPVNGCVDGVTCSEEEYQMNRRTEFLVIGHLATSGSDNRVVQRPAR